ncbi:HAD superfamily hydrolase (TIGR01490 family) [Actinomadura pelletieri DSM 43383]|uniref:HAD superfamily hydrolase (TIGR01490 family) n=1 Tax=Actinomadura pelletieri DSM 43383 TaxID=1120940 RepID=A0A495QYG2_9ACTN|nr:HAD-IB family hydrolase [Actinomadura pelletieri]RKS79064.1 HAD superfamily hydrolase (TIGR01490 family) [Actinomadura pelletieri DSM 43383]
MSDRLAGQTILLTGVTGFIGQAMLERLLSGYPDTRVVVVLREKPGVTADQRLDELITKPVFGPWRNRVGEDEARETVRKRVRVISADLTDSVPELPDDIDAIVHGASIVSFDPPIDEAFQTNVVGTVNLYESVRRAGQRGGKTPHIVHVSTAYVAGSRKGIVPETTLDHAIDWETELDCAVDARRTVERGSRRPEVLGRLRAAALREQGKAGPTAVAADTERRRREQVDERLIAYGRERARSLGWPDVYTFTKALGERAAEQTAHDLPLSIVRPAIVESSLRHPYPGWIDGFKMADPLILAYGQGLLRALAGIPDGIVDIIPVDLVVNALLAAAASPPEPGKPAYYHVGSGARNPLTLQRLVELVKEYFSQHPLPAADGRGAIRPRELKLLSEGRAEQMLGTAERAMEMAEKALLMLPSGDRTRGWQRNLYKQGREVRLLRRYRDLYGAYGAAEVVYADSGTQSLSASLPDDAGCDSAVIDWAYYLRDVHCPAVTAAFRLIQQPVKEPRPVLTAGPPPRPPVKFEERRDVVAVFDFDGTIVASDVVEAHLWARLLDVPLKSWPGTLAPVLRKVPHYLRTEHRDRGEFLREFVQRYEGANEEELRALARDRLSDVLLRRAWPQAIRRIRRHREAGHRTILLTGTLDVFVEPLRTLFDDILAARLRVVDGRCTGTFEQPPLIGEARGAWLRAWAGEEGVDLTGSWAYGDHYSDRPVLEQVGNPVAVNPDARLYRHAKKQRWTIADWDGDAGAVSTLLDAALEEAR